MQKKRGQIEMSFGMIFSIIIIIATIAVAFYFIQKFMNTSECVTFGNFYTDLQRDIDSAWKSPVAQLKFTGGLTSDIKSVCFGNLADAVGAGFSTQYAQLEIYKSSNNNIFLLPGNKACSGQAARHTLKNVDSSGFFCKNVVNGKVEFTIVKESATQALVKIKE